MLLVDRAGRRQIVPVLKPMNDASAAHSTSGHGVDPAMDDVIVRVEELRAEPSVPGAIMEDAPRGVGDLFFPFEDTHRGQRHERVRPPGGTHQLRRESRGRIGRCSTVG